MNVSDDESRPQRRVEWLFGISGPVHDRIAKWLLLAIAGWCVWRPVETFSSTAVLVAAAILGMAVWAWRRSPICPDRWLITIVGTCVLGSSGMAGWDPASAVTEIALLAATAALIWTASRVTPPEMWPACLGLVISGLTLWGIWQVTGGMDATAADIARLPAEMQPAAVERLASGRAFASQLLPSHFAVLLAMALPLLLARVRFEWSAAPWVVGSVLCGVGLALARSPVGAAIALLACTALALSGRKKLLLPAAVFLTAILVTVVFGRGDVREFEPVQLRVDNWRTAVWVWSKAPAAGVGVGGFAQAAQAVPFEVGNRPRHAHSLPLEWLAELGPVGLLATVFAALALWRVSRGLWPTDPELAVAVMVVPAHNLVDFSLYGSGVALPWAVLMGWALAINRGTSVPRSESAPGRIVMVVAVSIALAATVLHVTSVAVEESAVLRPSPTEQMNGAFDAHRLAPWRIDPLGIVAASALETGDPLAIETALQELDRGRWLRPRSAAFASLRARLALAIEHAPTAAAEAWAASLEQPSHETHTANFRALLGQLDPGDDDVEP